jgi:hypothetical protein
MPIRSCNVSYQAVISSELGLASSAVVARVVCQERLVHFGGPPPSGTSGPLEEAS